MQSKDLSFQKLSDREEEFKSVKNDLKSHQDFQSNLEKTPSLNQKNPQKEK